MKRTHAERVLENQRRSVVEEASDEIVRRPRQSVGQHHEHDIETKRYVVRAHQIQKFAVVQLERLRQELRQAGYEGAESHSQCDISKASAATPHQN